MRTVIKTEVIPATEAEEVQHTMFGCDHCDFESDDQEQVELHHGKNHACKKKIVIGALPGFEDTTGLDLFWFDTEDDTKSFLEAERGDFYRSDGVRWSGPGWYVKEYDRRPCPRGCCSDDYLGLVHIESRLSDMRDKARSIMGKHAEIQKAIRKEAAPCPSTS